MVIHDETELVIKLPIIKKPLYEAKSNIIPAMHEDDYENDPPLCISTQKSRNLVSENESEVQVRNPKKRLKKLHQHPQPDTCESTSKANTISDEDLDELITVYKKCKSVIRKIETKYGHLFDESGTSKGRKVTNYSTTEDESECHCTLNKKIVFDDDGKEIAIETVPADHICPKKPRYSPPEIPQPNNLQIEYYHQDIELPDSLQELKVILQNPDIDIIYRNQVIQKVKLIRQVFSDELRMNKRLIVEKLKANMDEMIDFKGSNLSSLPGYYVS